MNNNIELKLNSSCEVDDYIAELHRLNKEALSNESQQNWIFSQYLTILKEHFTQDHYPIEIQNRSSTNSPIDFLITLNNDYIIGIEVTEATIEKMKEGESKVKQGEEYTVEANGEIDIVNENGEISGQGYSGNHPEMIAVKVIHKSLVSKTCKIKQYKNSEECHEYHLAIVVNPTFIGYEINYVEKYLDNNIFYWGFDHLFDKVFIIDLKNANDYRHFLQGSGIVYRLIPFEELRFRISQPD